MSDAGDTFDDVRDAYDANGPMATEATFEEKARKEAEFLLRRGAPHKVGTPQGDQEIKAFLAGTRFAKKHYAGEIEQLRGMNEKLATFDRETTPELVERLRGREREDAARARKIKEQVRSKTSAFVSYKREVARFYGGERDTMPEKPDVS